MSERLSIRNSEDFCAPERLWDDAGHNSAALGCIGCPFRSHCGGIHIEAKAFDCTSFCEHCDIETCQLVCPKNTSVFVKSFREVGGFDLKNIPRLPPARAPGLQNTVPLICNGDSRKTPLAEGFVALSLYDLLNMRTGAPHVKTVEELAKRFQILPDSTVILSGVAKDNYVEAWWNLGDNRAEILPVLKALGVSLVTTPNFSVVGDIPRPHNLYNMKRIGMAWAEFIRAGIPCALHINSGTELGYQQWASFIRERKEVDAISFEFATGSGYKGRIDFHVQHLCALAQTVKRPLTLIVRGGKERLHELQKFFWRVIFIDTDSFVRAVKRRKAFIAKDGKLQWLPSPTLPGEPIDDILLHNIITVREKISRPIIQASEATAIRRSTPRIAFYGNDETLQPSLLRDNELALETGAVATNRQDVVITSKS